MVDRVDLVDEGANSAAFIQLYKRKENVQVMTFEEILKSLKPEHADVVKSAVEQASSEVPESTATELSNLEKRATEAEKQLSVTQEELAKAKEQVEDINKSKDEPDFEEVLKGLDPSVRTFVETLNKQKEAAEQVAKQAAEEKINNEAIAKAKELKALPVEEAKLVEVLKGISPEVHDILKSANNALENGDAFSEEGVSKGKGEATDAADAWAKIEKRADEIVKTDSVSKARAISMATRENPELYKQYLDGGAN